MRPRVLALCSLFLVACQPRQADAAAAPTVLEGDFTVSYDLQLSDTSTAGNRSLQAKRIAFHDAYVVVGDERAGSVFPIDRLIRFTWRASK
jgi:hypothetical protein